MRSTARAKKLDGTFLLLGFCFLSCCVHKSRINNGCDVIGIYGHDGCCFLCSDSCLVMLLIGCVTCVLLSLLAHSMFWWWLLTLGVCCQWYYKLKPQISHCCWISAFNVGSFLSQPMSLAQEEHGRRSCCCCWKWCCSWWMRLKWEVTEVMDFYMEVIFPSKK